MRTKKIKYAACLLITGFIITSAKAQSFDKNNDLLLVQNDMATDEDNMHSAVASGCILLHNDFAGINYWGVAGSRATQPAPHPGYINVMNAAFGTRWTNAWTDYNPNNGTGSAINAVKNVVRPVLDAGGTVWIAEGGQPLFTRSWMEALKADGITDTILQNQIRVVQHSITNETFGGQATVDAAAWVQNRSIYTKIGDGNVDNDSPDYKLDGTNFRIEAVAANNPNAAARVIMQAFEDALDASYNNEVIRDGGVDFSDAVAVSYALQLYSGPSNNKTGRGATVRAFWDNFVVNTPSGTLLEAENATISGAHVIRSLPSASAGQFVDCNAGATISWPFTDTAGGAADLNLRVKSSSGTRTMGVFVNNSKIGTFSTSSTSWEIKSFPATLQAGNNTVQVRDSEGANEADVDYLKVVVSGSGNSQVIASYNFNGGSTASSDSESSTTAGAYTVNFYSPSPGTTAFTSVVNGLNLPSAAATSSFDRDSNPTLANALNTVDFDVQTHIHRFTVTIPAGVTVSLDSIEFGWGVAETQSFNGLAPTLELVSNKTAGVILASDSFTVGASVPSNIYSPDGAGSLKGYNINLSNRTNLQNLTNTTVTFMFALDENTNKDGTTRRHILDNIILNGTVQ